MVASSILKAQGFEHVVNVEGGWNKIKESGVPISTGAPANVA
jgi:hypothetical protein